MLLSLPPNLTSAPLFAEVPLTPLTSASLVPEVFRPRPNLISPPSLEAEDPLILEVVASVFFSSPGLADILPLVLAVAPPVPVACLARRLVVVLASSPAAPATDLLPAVNLEVAVVAVFAAAPPLEVLVGVPLFAVAPFSFSSYCALSFCCFSSRAFFLASVADTPAVGLASLEGA